MKIIQKGGNKSSQLDILEVYALRHRLASLSVAMSGLFLTYIVLFQKYIKLFLKYLNLFLKNTLVLESRQCNSYVATCTSQQLQDCKFTIVVFNVLVSGKYGDKTVFQEPCVLQAKFGIFLVDVVRNRSNSKDQKTEPCISIAMGAMSKEEPPKKRCSKLCGSFWFVLLCCFRFSCLCFSVAGAVKIYEHM